MSGNWADDSNDNMTLKSTIRVFEDISAETTPPSSKPIHFGLKQGVGIGKLDFAPSKTYGRSGSGRGSYHYPQLVTGPFSASHARAPASFSTESRPRSSSGSSKVVSDKPKVISSSHADQSTGSGLIAGNDWMLQTVITAGSSLSINKTPPEPSPKPSEAVEALNSVSSLELSHQPPTTTPVAQYQAKIPIKKKRVIYEETNDKEEATLGDDRPAMQQVQALVSQQQNRKYPLRNSTSKKKKEELIDLANSDDDVGVYNYDASIKQFNSSTAVNAQKERFKPEALTEKDIVVVSILSPLKALHIGMLPIVHGSPVISLSCVAKKLSWNLIFHDVDGRQYKEDIESDYIECLKQCEVLSGHCLVLVPRDTLRLTNVAVGKSRILDPNASMRDKSSVIKADLPPSGRFIICLFSREEWSRFKDQYEKNADRRSFKKFRKMDDNEITVIKRIVEGQYPEAVVKERFYRAGVENIVEKDDHRDGATRPRRKSRADVVIDYSDPENRKTYVIFPIEPEAPDAVTVCQGDLKRLDPGVYFNDNLIDLKIKFILSRLEPERRKKIHAFSCHFYSKLTEGSSSNGGQAAHQLVARWTKNVNLFEMDFVFFPINLTNHWSLFVLVRPHLLWEDPRLNKVEPVEEMIDDGSSTVGQVLADRACLLSLDSLTMHPYKKIGKRLTSYLYYEWQARRKELSLEASIPEAEFVSCLPSVRCKVPQQMNGYDCGVFVGRFANMITDLWPSSTSHDINDYFSRQFFSSTVTQKDIDEERKSLLKDIDIWHGKWTEIRRNLGLEEAPISQPEQETIPNQDPEQQKPPTPSQLESKPAAEEEAIEDSSSSSAGSDDNASTSEDEQIEPYSFKVECQASSGEGGWQGREENVKEDDARDDDVVQEANTCIEQIFKRAEDEPEKLPSDTIRYDTTSPAIENDEGEQGDSRRRKRPYDSNDDDDVDDDQPAEYSQHSFFKENESPRKRKGSWAGSIHNTV
eukprot:scaffold1036_cov169-Ochromonas_danica.AAC.38